MISIVIPVYNEQKALRRHRDHYKKLCELAEVIFVDGGSEDGTPELARGIAPVISAPKNRALQMNAGARAAKGDILLFLHADALIEEGTLVKINEFIKMKGAIGGCLTQVLDEEGIIFRWIAFTGNVRAKLFKVFYGDQGIFIRKDVFDALDGFPKVKICEDVMLTRKLRKAGPIGILPCPIVCSARRWKKQGILKTFLMNARVTTGLAFGTHPDRLNLTYEDIRE